MSPRRRAGRSARSRTGRISRGDRADAAPVSTGLVEGWCMPSLAMPLISSPASASPGVVLGSLGFVSSVSHLRIDRETRRTSASTRRADALFDLASPSSPLLRKAFDDFGDQVGRSCGTRPGRSRASCPPGVPRRMPEVTNGGSGSKGMPFLLQVMPGAIERLFGLLAGDVPRGAGRPASGGCRCRPRRRSAAPLLAGSRPAPWRSRRSARHRP